MTNSGNGNGIGKKYSTEIIYQSLIQGPMEEGIKKFVGYDPRTGDPKFLERVDGSYVLSVDGRTVATFNVEALEAFRKQQQLGI